MKFRTLGRVLEVFLLGAVSSVAWAGSQKVDYTVFLFDQTPNDYIFKSVISAEYYLDATNLNDAKCLNADQRPIRQVFPIHTDALTYYEFHARTLKFSEGGGCEFTFAGGKIVFGVYSRANQASKTLQTTIDAYFRNRPGPRSVDLNLRQGELSDSIGSVFMESLSPVIRIVE